MRINFSGNRLSRGMKTGDSHIVGLLLLCIFLFTVIQDLVNWPILNFARVVSPIKNRDTFWVLADADCFRSIGSGIYGLESNTGCPGYVYGLPLLRALEFLHIGQEDTKLFAYAMRVLFALATALVIKSLKFSFQKRLLFTMVLLLSPGVQLMIYNGNFDLLIFAMVILAHFSIQNGKVISGLFLIFLSGLFKFYTIPLLLLFAILLPGVRNKIISLILFFFATVSAILDLRMMQEQIPSSGYAQFGFTIFSKYLEGIGFSPSTTFVYFMSSGIFLVMAYFAILVLKKQRLFDTFEVAAADNLYLVLSTVFLSCFLTGISYDPRLIFLSLAGLLLARVTVHWSLRIWIWVAILVSSLLSCGIELGFIPNNEAGLHPLRSVQLINDIAIEFLAVILFLSLLYWFIQLLQNKSQSR